jgi:hypothetical protein
MRATRLIKFKRLLPFDEGAYSIITDRARNGAFGPKRLPNLPGLPNGIRRRNPAAGNGIFGRRDGRLKSP